LHAVGFEKGRRKDKVTEAAQTTRLNESRLRKTKAERNVALVTPNQSKLEKACQISSKNEKLVKITNWKLIWSWKPYLKKRK
jgi:hypothetical protein